MKLYEAFKFAEFERVLTIIESYLTKKVGLVTKSLNIERIRQNDKIEYYGVRFLAPKANMFRLNWLTNPESKSSKIDSVDFWFTNTPEPTMKMRTDNLNIIQILAGIENVLKTEEDFVEKDDYINSFISADLYDQQGVILESFFDFMQLNESHLTKDEKVELVLLKDKMRASKKDRASKEDKLRFVYLRTKEMGFGDIADEVFTFENVEIEENIDPEEEERIKEFTERLNREIPIEEKFRDLKILITSVANGIHTSLIITGTAGVGKTFTVTKTLEDAGLKEGEDWVLIKGKSSPLGMYKSFYEWRDDKLLVFDDCDSVFRNEDGVNILKGALDSSTIRKISWKSTSTFNAAGLTQDEIDKKVLRGKYPDSVTLTSRAMFITNLTKSELLTTDMLAPLLSRASLLDMTFTEDEIIERIRTVIPYMDIFGMDQKEKLEVFDILVSASKAGTLSKDINFRTFEQMCKSKIAVDMHLMRASQKGEATKGIDENTWIEIAARYS